MRHTLKPLLIALSLLTAAAAPALAAEPAADAPFLSPVRVRDVPPAAFFHATLETTQSNIGKAIADPLNRLMSLHPGTPIVITRGAGVDPTKTVLVQVGVVVPDGTPAAGGFTVKRLDTFHCVSVLYGGPMRSLGAAYAKAYRDLFTAGFLPTGESRQTTLLYAGPDSPDNVILIQVGIK